MMTDAATKVRLADRIAPHLPLLRRYARALNGSQPSGDAHVAALLEAMIADPDGFDLGPDARVGLYRAFQILWTSLGLSDRAAAPAPADPREIAVAERLMPLPERPRQALLLTALEGFGIDQTATILDTTSDDVAELVAIARQELSNQTHSRVLIIEDEPIIAMDLEALITEMGHTVVGIADTRTDAVEAALSHRPDLILADIQLADGSSGIDAVRDILEQFSVPVIFITAYPDRLLTGQRPEPTFLITKPFRTETVQATVAQALFFRATVAMA